MRRSIFVLATAAFAACGPVPSDPNDTLTATGEPATGDDGTTAGDSANDSTATDPGVPTTTGDETSGPGTLCSLEPPFTPLWSSQLELPPPEGNTWIVDSLAALSDGRLAVAGAMRTADLTFAPGVFWAAADGEPLGWTPGALKPAVEVDTIGLRVAADDTVVLVGPQVNNGEGMRPYVSRFAPGGGELTRVDAATDDLNWPLDFELHGDGVVVSGYDLPAHNFWLAKVDGVTGAAAWEVMLPGLDLAIPRLVAVGPGGELVAGSGQWPTVGSPLFKVWRVDDAGAVVWERDLFEPGPGAGALADLIVTPDGQVIAATLWYEPTPKVALTALSLADGAPTWELDVAVEDATGSPVLKRMFIDGDALALPIAHAVDLWNNGVTSPITASLHRVAFTGAPLSTDLLTPGDELGSPWLVATRGVCGDLVVYQNDLPAPWLGSFAP